MKLLGRDISVNIKHVSFYYLNMTIIIIYFSRPGFYYINNRNDLWNQKQIVNNIFEMICKYSTDFFQFVVNYKKEHKKMMSFF